LVTAAPVSSDAAANSLLDCLNGGRLRGRPAFPIRKSSKTQYKAAKGAREERHGYRDGSSPMAHDDANAPTDFEAPAPVCVCGLLVVTALTKGGHPHWGIGGMISAYVFYLAVQYAKDGAGSARALGVTDSIIMNIRTSTGLMTAATIAAATVLMSGAVAVVAGSHLEEGLRCPIRILAGDNGKARERFETGKRSPVGAPQPWLPTLSFAYGGGCASRSAQSIRL
jgi:hypothetical protein